MRKILVCSESRAERGLLEPIMIELQKRNVEAKWCELSPARYPLGQNTIEQFKSHLAIFNPDIVLVPCDRDAMVYVAAHAFHEGKIIAHFHAGDMKSGTSDESNRFAISFMSHIFFCNSVESAENLYKMGFEFWRVHIVGSTALDGNIEIDESFCPKEPYDLVLLHPDPVSKEATNDDLQTLGKIIDRETKPIIWLEPNRDRNYEIILSAMKECDFASNFHFIFENLPRSRFLGLLKNCKRFIGNSSSGILEFPLINKSGTFIQIGHRNKERTPPNMELDASAKIAEILATIPIDDKLRRKKIIL